MSIRKTAARLGSTARSLFNVVFCLALMGPTLAYASCRDNAMIVFDASGSMSASFLGERRIDVARRAIGDVLPEVTSTRATGLVSYGGLMAHGCFGVELRLPPMNNSATLIDSELRMLGPGGQTPLTEAVWLAAQVLDDGSASGTVVLVTDGKENCGLNACSLGMKLKSEAPQIKVHVIGFHLRSRDEQSVACLADRTSGTYTSTRNYEELREALRETLSCPRISQRPMPHHTGGVGRTDLAALGFTPIPRAVLR